MWTREGTFDAVTSGSQPAITGLPGTPKAIVFKATKIAADGAAAGASLGIGFCASTTQRETIAWAADDNVGTTNTGGEHAQRALEILSDGTPTVYAVMDISSFDANGFTPTWVTYPTSAFKISYWAIGGGDITAEVGTFTTGTATGNVSKVLAAAFRPDLVMMMGCRVVNASRGAQSAAAPWFGAMTNDGGAMQGCSMGWLIGDNASTNVVNRGSYTAGPIWQASQGGLRMRATPVSMDATGFTFNLAVAPSTSTIFAYLAIKGGNWRVMSDTTRTTAGTKATTGASFQPETLLGFSAAIVTGLDNNTRNDNGGVMLGGFEPTGSGRSVSVAWSNAVTFRTESRIDPHAYRQVDNLGGDIFDATVQSFDAAGGFTLNYTSAPATARYIFAIVGATSALPQKSRAMRVVSNSGGFTREDGTTNNLEAGINEAVADDNTYIQSVPNPAIGTTKIMRWKIDPANPPSAGNQIFKTRYKSDAAGTGTLNLKSRLYQGGGATEGAGTLVIERQFLNVLTGVVEDDYTLSGGEAATITDRGELYREIEVWMT